MSIHHRYVVMAATDTADWRASDGPMVFETIGRDMGLTKALERMDRGHGDRQLCRLTYVDGEGVRMDGAEAIVAHAIAGMKAALCAMAAANITTLEDAMSQLRARIADLERIDV